MHIEQMAIAIPKLQLDFPVLVGKMHELYLEMRTQILGKQLEQGRELRRWQEPEYVFCSNSPGFYPGRFFLPKLKYQ